MHKSNIYAENKLCKMYGENTMIKNIKLRKKCTFWVAEAKLVFCNNVQCSS